MNEKVYAITLANKFLDDPSRDPDSDISVLSRQFLRSNERISISPVDLQAHIVLLTNVCQLLDGWHSDGTAWSEWDESIRKECSERLLALSCLVPAPVSSL